MSSLQRACRRQSTRRRSPASVRGGKPPPCGLHLIGRGAALPSDARDVLRSSLEHLRDVDVANSASLSSASSASSGVSVSGDDHLSAGDAEKRYRWLRGVTQRIRAEVIAALSVPAASQPQSMQDVRSILASLQHCAVYGTREVAVLWCAVAGVA
jgi:hypothetical protein